MSANTHQILLDFVANISCKTGWTFGTFVDNGALRLVITVEGFDSYDRSKPLVVSHTFPVPMATYNYKTWCRWVFECCRGVENHELGEWFRVSQSVDAGGGQQILRTVRPFAPLHGPGENPYVVHEFRDDEDRRTMQDGTIVNKLGD